MKATILLAILGVAIGFAAGFLVGRGGRAEESPESVGEVRLIGRAPREAEGKAADGAGIAAPVLAIAPERDAEFKDKNEYVKGLAASDPMRAIAWAQANSDEGLRDDLFQTIALEWAKRDPEAAFRWANGLPLKQEREDAVRGVMEGALEAGHEEVALSFIARLPPGEYQDTAMVAAVKHLAATDLDRAFELAGAMGETFAMYHAGCAMADVLIASGRIDEAKQRISGMPYGLVRSRLVAGVANQLGKKDVTALIAWIDARPAGPDGAALFDTTTMRNVANYSLARNLMTQRGPEEALAWAAALDDAGLRDRFLETVGDDWASRAPQEASKWLIDSLNGRGFDGLEQVSRGIFEEWIEVDQSALFEMIEGIADPETRRRAGFMALEELINVNPRVAAERMAPYASADPKRAAGLAGRLVQNWLRRDPEQASIWLNAQPAGAVKDRGVEQLVRAVLEEDRDVATARAWLGEIQNQDLQTKLVRIIEQVGGGTPLPRDPFAE